MSSIRHYFSWRAGVALLALAIAIAAFGGGVGKAASPDRGPWPYQFQGNCTYGAGECPVRPPVVPEGKRLVIQHVSVVMTVPTGVQPKPTLQVVWTGMPGGGGIISKEHFLDVTQAAVVSGYVNYRGNNQVLAFADPGSQPQVWPHVFGTGSPHSLQVTVSGYLEAL